MRRVIHNTYAQLTSSRCSFQPGDLGRVAAPSFARRLAVATFSFSVFFADVASDTKDGGDIRRIVDCASGGRTLEHRAREARIRDGSWNSPQNH